MNTLELDKNNPMINFALAMNGKYLTNCVEGRWIQRKPEFD
jgi:hypothetical protein